MSTIYPSQIDDPITLPPVIDNATAVNGRVVNALRDAILAIENELGVKPSSIYGTIRERLDAIEAALVNGGSGGTVIFGGDLIGSAFAQTVVGLRGRPITTTAPSVGQVLSWSGSSWGPTTIITTTTIQQDGSTISGNPFSTLNFKGPGVLVSNGGSSADIEILGVGTNIPDPSAIQDGYQLTGVAPDIGLWAGAAGICFDGKYLWISDGNTNGSGSFVSTIPLLRIVDTSIIPKLIATVDLSAYLPFTSVRELRMSSNQQFILASILDATPGQGRVLVIDKNTRSVVGNAITTAGLINGNNSIGARSAVDDGTGNLFVINSNQHKNNVVEKFNFNTVLSNGASPTSSIQTINIPNHAEVLCFGDGYVWTAGGAWSKVLTRIDPSIGSISEYTDPTYFLTGCFFAFGAVWAITFSTPIGNVMRFDPAQFGTLGFLTDTVPLSGIISSLSMISDGSYIWAGSVSLSTSNGFVQKLSTTGGSVSVIATIDVPGSAPDQSAIAYELAYDGKNIWGTQRQKTPSGCYIIDALPGSEKLLNSNWYGDVSLEWRPDNTPVYEINFVNGTHTASNGTTTVIAERVVDISAYPQKIGNKVLKIKRYIYANTSAGTGTVAMFNVTDSVFVNPTNTFTSSTTTEFIDDLTIGSNGFEMTKQYQIQLSLAGAGVTDIATCLHVRLQLYYVLG